MERSNNAHNRSGVLVIAESNEDTIHQVTFELLGKGREIANELRCELGALLLCANVKQPEEMISCGCDKAYVMRSNSFLCPEEVLYKANIVKFIEEHKPEVVLIGATPFGRSLAPRVAAALGTGLTADCTELAVGEEGELIQIRPAFSDNILAHIKTRTFPQMATVRYGEFPVPEAESTRKGDVIQIPPYVERMNQTYILEGIKRNVQELTEADIVVACGRGLKAEEDVALIQKLADCLGGRVGYSRALVDAGIGDATSQIGYSGLRVRPKLYFACGISGAPQHLAGMKESGKIIAINQDASAPIFNVCDLGIVGDLYQVIPRLIEELSVSGI